MNILFVAFNAEIAKLKRSRVFWIISVIFIMLPMMTGFLVYLSRNPDLAAKLGMMGTKAQLLATNDWNGFFGLVHQSCSSIGLIGFGFIAAWVFGREYTDRTIREMLILPVSRTTFVLAKFMLIFFWSMILASAMYIVFMLTGLNLGFEGWSEQGFADFNTRYFISALFTTALCTFIGFVSSVSRGYFASMGVVVLIMLLAQFAGVAGLGPYFPWSVPGLFAMNQASDGMQVTTTSFMIVLICSVAGFIGTIWYWRKADQH